MLIRSFNATGKDSLLRSTIALRNKHADARGHSYCIGQVLHQSMQASQSY